MVRRDALGGEDVLERERHTGQGAELLAPLPLGVDGAGLRERALAVDVQEGVHLLVDGLDPGEVLLRRPRRP